MVKKKEDIKDDYSSMVNNNAILLSFEGWIKYIEGFIKGISTSKSVESNIVLDCVGEILEFMTTFKSSLMSLLLHCEQILERNEELIEENKELKKELEKLNAPKLEVKNGKEM